MTHTPTTPTMLVEPPKTYEELLARPGFEPSLTKGTDDLGEVLSHYSFQRLIPCGLSECRKAHYHGFLVRTVGGRETNVGHVCGSNAFGDSFDIKRAAYQRQRDRNDLLSRAAIVTGQAPEIRRLISEVNGGRFGIRWVKEVRAALLALLGDGLLQSLQATQRQQNFEVTAARERSAAEVEAIVARTRQRRELVRYETVRVGTLEPMPWLVFDFEGTLRDGLLIPLETFTQLKHEEMNTPRLRKAVRPFDNWERSIQDAGDAAASAVRFLARENLELLSLWVPDQMVSRRRAIREWPESKAFRTLAAGRNPA